jgi:cell division septum initiation protein DivIVA
MFGRAAAGSEAAGRASAKADAAETAPERPNLTGDLDDLLGFRPVFRTRQRGYDRLQVDNYVDWAESQLAAARRQVDQLLDRYGACAAELEISRRLLADAQRGRDVFPVSERVQEMLRLAADEAAAITEAGADEADRVIAEARTEADAWLRKAREIKETAVAAADELLEHARHERSEATAALERARSEAEEILRAAAVERARLDEDAAAERRRADEAATAHLLKLQERVDGLCRRSHEARESLHQLADRVGQALEAVVGPLPDVAAPPDQRAVPAVRMVDNIVADTHTDGPGDRAEDRVLVPGRPWIVPS